MSKEGIKDFLSKLLEGFRSPLMGLFIGLYGVIIGYYIFKVESNPEGIMSFIVGCAVLVVAVLTSKATLLERKIEELKESLKDATIGIPRYKRDEREPIGPNYNVNHQGNAGLTDKVITK